MIRICYLSKVWKNGTISDPSIELHFLCDWDSLGDSLGDSFVFFLASIEIRLGVRLEIRLDLSVATSGIRFNVSLVNTFLSIIQYLEGSFVVCYTLTLSGMKSAQD